MRKLPDQGRLAALIVAFEAQNELATEARAALGHAAIVIVDEVFADIDVLTGLERDGRLAAHWDGLTTTAWLPPKWRLAATKGFFLNWAVALVSVAYGLGQKDWAGPACIGEEVAFAAVCEYALLLPGMDADKLEADIARFQDDVLQDADFEGLFRPEMDGIDEGPVGEVLGMSSLRFEDVFRPFTNRTGHPYHLDAGPDIA